jgi:hypothetical protein
MKMNLKTLVDTARKAIAAINKPSTQCQQCITSTDPQCDASRCRHETATRWNYRLVAKDSGPFSAVLGSFSTG